MTGHFEILGTPAACREPAGKLWQLCKVLYVFEHKTQYLLIMLHLPALWHFDTSVTYPQWFRRVKFVVIPPRFVKQQYLWNIAIQPAVGCYNWWTNLRCSSCSPLGEKIFVKWDYYCHALCKISKWLGDWNGGCDWQGGNSYNKQIFLVLLLWNRITLIYGLRIRWDQHSCQQFCAISYGILWHAMPILITLTNGSGQ